MYSILHFSLDWYSGGIIVLNYSTSVMNILTFEKTACEGDNGYYFFTLNYQH